MSRARVHVPSNYRELSRPRLVNLVGRLMQVIDALEKENQELQREAKGQTARFSKGKKPGKHKKPGRKAGQGQFTNRPPPRPEEITETQTVAVPQVCPHCGESDIDIGWEDAFITELPEPKPIVKHYRRPVGTCPRCKHHWRAPHPDLADDQFGATAHRLGPRLRSSAHVLHYHIGVPVRKVPQVLKELQRVSVTQSGLTQDALRTASAGPVRERYEQIKDSFVQAPVVHVDPTSWRKAGKSAAMIVFATPDTLEAPGKTVYLVRDHHGADEIIEVLGEGFQGTLTSDRGAEFDSKKLKDVRKQKCNSHIKHNLGKVLETKVSGGARRFCIGLRRLLDQARQLRRDYDEGRRELYEEKVAKLEADLTHYLRSRKLSDPDNQRMLEQIGRQHAAGNVLRFLHDTRLSPDNHLAEREIRPAVVARKVSHCSKNDAGAQSHGVHSTVYRTENRAERREKTGRGIIGRVIDLFKPRRASSDVSESSNTPPTPTAAAAVPAPTAAAAVPAPTAALAAPTPTAAAIAPTATAAAAVPTPTAALAAPTSTAAVVAPTPTATVAAPTPTATVAAPTPTVAAAAPAPSTAMAAATALTPTAAAAALAPTAAAATPTPTAAAATPTPTAAATRSASVAHTATENRTERPQKKGRGTVDKIRDLFRHRRTSSETSESGKASPAPLSPSTRSPCEMSSTAPPRDSSSPLPGAPSATPVSSSRSTSPPASSCAPVQSSLGTRSSTPASGSAGAPPHRSSVASAPPVSRAPPRHHHSAP